MIKRITLENFMSHASTIIEPAAGLTVLTGPNNCGKSAIVTALQTVCGDHDGDFMVRHGEKTCQVTIQSDDDHTVTWRRIKGKVSYVIDGTEIHRTGRGNLPDELHAVLKLCKVGHPNGRDEFDVHFGNQKSPIFLIDREGDAAAFFSTASDAEKLLEVQRRHKEKVREKRNAKRELAQELTELDAILQALMPLDPIDEALKAVEAQRLELLEEQAGMAELELLLGQRRDQQSIARYHQQCESAVALLERPPILEETGGIEELVGKIASAAEARDRAAARTAALRVLRDPPALEDAAGLERLEIALAQAGRRASRLNADAGALAALVEPPELEDTAALCDLGVRLSQAGQTVSAAARAQRTLSPLAEPPALDDPAAIADLLERLHNATELTRRARLAIDAIHRDLALIEEQIEQWLWANPTCPLCGGVTTRENVLEGGHVHELPDRQGVSHD